MDDEDITPSRTDQYIMQATQVVYGLHFILSEKKPEIPLDTFKLKFVKKKAKAQGVQPKANGMSVKDKSAAMAAAWAARLGTTRKASTRKEGKHG